MSRARDLSKIGNKSTLAVDTDNIEVGIGSTVPSSTLDVRGEIKVGTAVQLGSAGVVTATSFSGSGANLTNVGMDTGFIVSVATTAGNLTVSAAATISQFLTVGHDLTVSDSIAVTRDINVGSAGTFGGAVNIDATTDSTSTTTGALIVDGGLGVAKNVYIGAGLSVAGTLTYEDVTNVDSVGLITAKSGVNVSGGQVTIGTGITMGIAGVATFSGTSDVHLLDSVRLNVGDGSDLAIYHDGNNSYIQDSGTGVLRIASNQIQVTNAAASEVQANFIEDGAVELYHNNVKTFETIGAGITIYGPEGGAAQICLSSDEGDDNADKWRITKEAGNSSFRIQNYTSGSWETNILATGDAGVHLYYDNSTVCYTDTAALRFNDSQYVKFGSSQDLTIVHNGTNSLIQNDTGYLGIQADTLYLQDKTDGHAYITCVNDGAVGLRYDNSEKLATTNDGVKITGIATCSNGLDTVGMLRESYNTVANKLSAAPNIDVYQGMVHYFTTTETTTATPNLRYTSTQALNDFMSAGDAITVTLITNAAAAGYSANWQIDGSGITEEWVGGSAPTAGGSDGYDIYTANILKLGDASWKVFINLVNAT